VIFIVEFHLIKIDIFDWTLAGLGDLGIHLAHLLITQIVLKSVCDVFVICHYHHHLAALHGAWHLMTLFADMSTTSNTNAYLEQ
jgi:hypothetical protein